MTYRAAILHAQRQITLDAVRKTPLEPGQVRARIRCAGICGTDLALFSGDYTVPLPLVPGHEWVGVIEEVGENVDTGVIGKPIVAEINNTCRAWRKQNLCGACRRGLDNHCLERTVTGIIRHPGAFADYITVPINNIQLLPASFPMDQGVLIEPLAAALQTFELSPPGKDDNILLLGCGRLGILIAITAKALGLNIVAATRSRASLALAEQFGISTCQANRPEDLVSDMKAATKDLGMDMVIDATGSPEGLPLAVQCVRPRGTIAIKSTPGLGIREFPLTPVVVDEIQMQGSRCGNFARAIQFFTDHKLDLSPLLRHRFPLEQIESAIECAAAEPGKTLLTISDC